MSKHECDLCEYHTNSKGEYERHTNRKKHISAAREEMKCRFCLKKLSSIQSLCRHEEHKKRAIYAETVGISKIREYNMTEFYEYDAGSTVVITIITPEHIIIINIGDSWCVLIKDGKFLFSTDDHNGMSESECYRIEASGKKLHGGRICGSIAVTRAIGDLRYETEGIGRNPDITIMSREASGKYTIVTATDGLDKKC